MGSVLRDHSQKSLPAQAVLSGIFSQEKRNRGGGGFALQGKANEKGISATLLEELYDCV